MSNVQKQEFIAQVRVNGGFGKNASQTGIYNADEDTVLINDSGQAYYTFNSLEDYADHEFLNKDVVYLISEYVGDRDDEGSITWHHAPFPPNEIDNSEDGGCVYTEPKLYANIDNNLLEDINNADAFDLLGMVLKSPELVKNELTLELLRRKNTYLAQNG
jgi:hypothetical protein